MAEILLTPEILMAQSAQMQTLGSEFESLFAQVTTVLHVMNDSWSKNIASNFVSKILFAQQSFSSIVNMLENGSAAARVGAMSFANGVNMGNILDNVNNVYDSANGWSGSPTEGTGKPKEDYWKNLGEVIRQDFDDLEEMITGDKTPTVGDVTAKYIDMVDHYLVSGPAKAFCSATGLNYEETVKRIKGLTGEIIGGITGDPSGMREAYENSYQDGLGKGFVEGVEDTVDYVLNNTDVGRTAVKIWKSIF